MYVFYYSNNAISSHKSIQHAASILIDSSVHLIPFLSGISVLLLTHFLCGGGTANFSFFPPVYLNYIQT